MLMVPLTLLEMDTKIIPCLVPIVFIDLLKLEQRSKKNEERNYFNENNQTEASIGIHLYHHSGDGRAFTVCTYEKQLSLELNFVNVYNKFITALVRVVGC